MLCYVMLCYVMLCYVMLCYVMCHQPLIVYHCSRLCNMQELFSSNRRGKIAEHHTKKKNLKLEIVLVNTVNIHTVNNSYSKYSYTV
jgi:hypothetical protein